MLSLQDYQNWLKIADAALPQNVVGYLIQFCLEPFRADPFTLQPYGDPKEIAKCGQSAGTTGFLSKPLRERDGPRPEISKWIAPNRQVSQFAEEDMHRALAEAIDELVARYSSHVVVRTSVMEKAGDALQIADGVPTPHAIAKSTKREIAHVHSGDHSLHLCLSPADCKEVVGKAWGERMSLAGTLVPNEYLIIYAPRTVDEVLVVKDIVEAAILFMTLANRDTCD